MPSDPPPTWYFPTEDPDWVIACDYNPAEKQYNLNRRRMRVDDIPQHVASAIDQSRQG